MLKEMFSTAPDKTYATRAGAVAAFEKAAAKVGVTDMKYVMSVTEAGRFFVITLPGEDEVQDAINFAHFGVCSVRT